MELITVVKNGAYLGGAITQDVMVASEPFPQILNLGESDGQWQTL